MVVTFTKSLLVLKTGKKLLIQNSYCLDKNYGSECFFWGGHFSLILFFLPFPLPFSKKKNEEEEINPENT